MNYKKLMVNLIALVFFLTLTVAVMEVLFRMIDFPFDESWEPSKTNLMQFDSELGWVYIPGKKAVQEFGDSKRSITMNFDSIGARALAADRLANPDIPTILMIGGSFTMGQGDMYEESVSGILESELDGQFQAINLGVQVYGTDQSLLMLERHIEKFNVKAVIYTFISAHIKRNANNDRRLVYRRGRFMGTKPVFALDNTGTPVLKKRPQRYEDFSYSRVWALLRMAYLKLGPRPSLELTKSLILAMKDRVESLGAEFIVVDWDQDWSNPEYGGLNPGFYRS